MSEPVIQRFGEDITLYCADCRDILPIPADSVITDPPYGVNFKQKETKWTKERVHNGYDLYNDIEEITKKLIKSVIPRLIRSYEHVILTPGSRLMFDYPKPDDVGGIYDASDSGHARWGFSCFHPIFYYGKDPYLQHGKGSRPNSFQRWTNDYSESNGHPCPKPIKTMEWLVTRGSLPGMTVLDPFMGSGTTGVACLRTGRKFVGIEISRQYFDIACERIERELKQQTLFPARPIMKEQQALI